MARHGAARAGGAMVLGDDAFDGSENLLHRRIGLHVPHNAGFIAYWRGRVTEFTTGVSGLAACAGAVRVAIGRIIGPSSQSDQLRA